MYLNDGAEGGETHFPQLNISVAPKRGRALLWPSVLDSDPNERDFRTEHEAVTVTRGQKFAANYWLHMWDFQYANDRGCGNNEVFGVRPSSTSTHPQQASATTSMHTWGVGDASAPLRCALTLGLLVVCTELVDRRAVSRPGVPFGRSAEARTGRPT